MFPRVATDEVDRATLSSPLTGMDVASQMRERVEPEESADVCVLAKAAGLPAELCPRRELQRAESALLRFTGGKMRPCSAVPKWMRPAD